jgi:hypothetical protein
MSRSGISSMSSPNGLGLAVILIVSLLYLIKGQLGSAQAPARCVLAGTVLNSATNGGIGHALVSYAGAATGFRFTDASGAFHVENVPAGQYMLIVSKPGFVSEQELASKLNAFAQIAGRQEMDDGNTEQAGRPPSQTNVMVELKPDSEPARIQLLPMSSIGGTVLDENSEPLDGVSIQVIAVQASLTGTDYASVQTGSTDDRGRYLFHDLLPGDYVIRLAGEISSTGYYIGTLNVNNDHRGMRPVYYPNGDSTASASVLHLAPGEQANADFQQPTEAAFDINGRLAGFTSQAWTQMQLYRDGDRLPVARAFVNLSSGQFRVTDVPPGSYILRAAQYRADPPQWYAAETQVSISSEPIRGLVVELSAGMDIRVSVAYEAGAQADGLVRLSLQPEHTRENARNLVIGKFAQPEGANADLHPTAQPNPAPEQPSVLADVVPDRYRLIVFTAGHDYVASARFGDQDILQREFPVGAGGTGEIHIIVKGDSAFVQGQVTFKGQPALGASVYLIPAAGTGTDLKFGFSDPSGHYEIAGVRPGEYRILAWTAAPSAAALLSGTGQTLTLQPGERQTLSLEARQSGQPDISAGPQ